MSDISASAVQSLRARTGVSILACKNALEEAGGDEEKAIEILRKRGLSQAAKKADRDQTEGLVFVKEAEGKGALVAIACETDFVARDDNFQKAGEEIVSALLADGKEAAEKVAADTVPDLVQKLGENISVRSYDLVEAPTVGTYIHSNAKIGVLVGLSGGTPEMARDVAMHAAAMNPQFSSPDQVTDEAIEQERGIWKDQLKEGGKPEDMWDKIMLGKEKKFREEQALSTQSFVKDPSKTVAEYLGDATIVAYIRVAITG